MMSTHDIPLKDYRQRLEQLARSLGMDFHPVDFELVPPHFMTEIAVYGLPVRMPHWSFGVRYMQQMVRQNMGHSRIFEVMFPGDRCHAYLVSDNTLAENTLVIAHVLGHADFAKNNYLFAHFLEMAGGHILQRAASHARRIEAALQTHGQVKPEAVLDAALALEAHIDTDKALHRMRYPASPAHEADAAARSGQLPFPPHPESDLLWFIAHYAPDMEDWERDIFLAVRDESFYFYP